MPILPHFMQKVLIDYMEVILIEDKKIDMKMNWDKEISLYLINNVTWKVVEWF